MTTAVANAVPVREGGTPPGHRARAGRNRKIWIAVGFMAPALVMLGALVIYPIGFTIYRSFFDASGDNFVGGQNYVDMFTDASTQRAILNNFIWVVVAPIACTVLGLVFAVLMDRIRWKTAFRLIIFMPMAISMLAAGVIFRMVFQQNPDIGLANAIAVSVNSVFSPSAAYPGAQPRPDTGVAMTDAGAFGLEGTVTPGDTADFPLIGIRPDSLPDSATEAVATQVGADSIGGTVWLDAVVGGGGVAGELGDGKLGLPGVTVEVIQGGQVAGQATTADDGTWNVSGLDPGEYEVRLPESNFSANFAGISWLGPQLINFVVILSYVWIWAGFAMIMISSGLSAMDRSLQEAARIDGANEWQVFRRITAPLLMPVLVVVFVTLIINVLKIFDLVYVIPPGQSKPAANVIAVEMWNTSFGGGNDQGLGSALAILLLVLVLPSMIINVRRFRQERSER